MPSPIRVGIIGLGAIGQRLIKGFAAHPGFEIAAVCDVNGALTTETAQTVGATAFTDYHALLQTDVDLVYVAVPPKFHHRMVLDTVAAGKHILCEKPLAQTLSEAREMVEAVKESGLVHAMNLPLHYAPGARAFADYVRQGYMGALQRIDLELVFPQWPRAWQMTPWVGQREQGGAIREVGPHMFHQVLANFGPVKRVQAVMEYPTDPVAAENGAAGILELASGQLVTVSLLCNLPRKEVVSLTAFGSAGTLGMTQWTQPVGAPGDAPMEPLPVTQPTVLGLLDNLYAAVQGKQADLCGLDTGLAIQELLDAWERAAATGDWALVGD